MSQEIITELTIEDKSVDLNQEKELNCQTCPNLQNKENKRSSIDQKPDIKIKFELKISNENLEKSEKSI